MRLIKSNYSGSPNKWKPATQTSYRSFARAFPRLLQTILPAANGKGRFDRQPAAPISSQRLPIPFYPKSRFSTPCPSERMQTGGLKHPAQPWGTTVIAASRVHWGHDDEADAEWDAFGRAASADIWSRLERKAAWQTTMPIRVSAHSL